MKCKAILICRNTQKEPTVCLAETVDEHEGHPVCWTHKQVTKGPRYEKGPGARYSPLEFAKR